MIYASSSAVYGDTIAQARCVNEAVSPQNPYSRLKLECEELVCQRGGISLRLANLCGLGQPQGTILADILGQLNTQGPLLLRDTSAVRDFLWLADVAHAITLILGTPSLASILNIGSGVGISTGELAARVLRASGRFGVEVRGQLKPRQSILWLDISETYRQLTWKPEISIEQGVQPLLKIWN